MIRLFLVDDHPVVREGLAAVLGDQSDFVVVGTAGTLAETVSHVAQSRPDVLLLDLALPDGNGADLVPDLLQGIPGLAVLVFTAYDADERVLGALRSGARGYLLKGVSADEIARAVRTVHGGGSYLEGRVAARLVAQIGAVPHSSKASTLSAREREVLGLVVQGLPNKQIAHVLHIAERTVKFHLSSILRKLDATGRAQAAALAVQRGLL